MKHENHKYDHTCNRLRAKLRAKGVILIVQEGVKGSGYSVGANLGTIRSLSNVLRSLADQLDKDGDAEADRKADLVLNQR
jgi:hypothetical protein